MSQRSTTIAPVMTTAMTASAEPGIAGSPGTRPYVGPRAATGDSATACADEAHTRPADAPQAEHLAELVGHVRERLQIEDAFDDAAILASLIEIAASGERSQRWKAAFNSALGHWLALRGRDLNTALSVLVALLPPARS